MKKMIKTAAVIMSTIMVFSMTACAKNADPKEVFDAAVKKNSELTSLDMDTTMKMTMTQGEETMDITVDMNMKMSNMNEDSMQYLADTKTSLMGQSMDARIFYKDGYYYMDGMGQKIKYPMDLNSMIASVEQTTAAADLAPSLMKSLSVREEGENRVLSYVADPAKMNAYVQDALKPLLGSMDVGMIIREVKGEYVINKDDYYMSMNMYMVMDMSSYGETLRIIMLLEGNFNNPGQPVNLELPSTDGYSDLSTYYGTSRGSSGATGPAAEIW